MIMILGQIIQTNFYFVDEKERNQEEIMGLREERNQVVMSVFY